MRSRPDSRKPVPRRFLSLHLPDFATDRLRRRHGLPAERALVAARDERGRRVVAAASPAAASSGIRPGLPLADARAFLPGLAVWDEDPAGDAAALARLAEWSGRYTPAVAVDGGDGIGLDITGCAHLRGGEAALAETIVARLAALGFSCRAAVAGTQGAAWGVAGFAGEAVRIVPAGDEAAALASLPVAALRLAPETAYWLERLGLRRIGELLAVPRAALAPRFGAAVARRLDEALGRAAEPFSPLAPPPAHAARLAFAEPVATAEDLDRAMRHLVTELCRGLAARGAGARRLDLAFYRVDGVVERVALGTARASRDPRHLAKLLAEKLAAVDPGLGIEEAILAVPTAEPLAAAQLALPKMHRETRRDLIPPPLASGPLPLAGEGKEGAGEALANVVAFPGHSSAEADEPPPEVADTADLPWRTKPAKRKEPPPGSAPAANEASDLAVLVDRLGARLGLGNVHRLAPVASHLPERAQARAPALDIPGGRWAVGKLRPVRLLAAPEAIEATAPVPDDPPVLFRWRRLLHRVVRADGPERIAAEWWREAGPPDPDDIRDYYRVEDTEGRRFWLYRAGLFRPGAAPRWYLHGVFG